MSSPSAPLDQNSNTGEYLSNLSTELRQQLDEVERLAKDRGVNENVTSETLERQRESLRIISEKLGLERVSTFLLVVKAQIGAAVSVAFEVAIFDHFSSKCLCIGHNGQNNWLPGNGPIEHSRPFVADLTVSLHIMIVGSRPWSHICRLHLSTRSLG